VVYGRKLWTEMKGNNNGGFTSLRSKNTVKSVKNGCFSGVVTTADWY